MSMNVPMRLASCRARSWAWVIAIVWGCAFADPSARAQTWNQTATGTYSWNSTANWSPASIPNAVGATANLSIDIGAAQTINLNAPITVGTMLVGDSGTFNGTQTIAAGTGNLTFNNGGSGATLTFFNVGVNNIAANFSTGITLNDNLTVVNANTDTNRNNAPNFSGRISGTGGINLTGGMMWLNNTTNDFSGGFTLNGTNARAVTGGNGAAFGTGTLTIASGAVDTSFSGAAVQSLTTTNANVWTGNWTLSTATWTNNGTVSLGGNVNLNRTGTLILNQSISETGGNRSLTLSGTGTTNFNATNTYTGGTTISGGTAKFATLLSMPATGTVAIQTGATLALNAGGAGEWTNATSGTGSIGGLLGGVGGQGNSVTYAGAVTLGVDTTNAVGGALEYSGTIANVATTLALNKLGTGTLVVSSNNTYTGGTTITGGTLQVGNGGTSGRLPTSGALVNNSALVFNRSNNVVQGTDFTNSAMSGTGSLTMLGSGTLTLSAANSYSGNTYVPGTLSLTHKSGISGSALDTTSGGVVSLDNGAGTYVFGGLIGTANLTSIITGNATNLTSLTLQPAGSVTYTGVISDLSSGMTLTKSGAGTQTLGSANTYTGATTVTNGTLSVSTLANGNATSSIGASTAAATGLILNGGTLQYTGVAVTTDRLFSLQASTSLDASGAGAVNFSNSGSMGFNGGTAAKTLTVRGSNPGANTIAAVIGNNTGATAVTKDGTGLWVLSGNNTYTGVVTVTSGILRIINIDTVANPNPLGQSATTASNLVLNGGTLQYSGSAKTTDRLFQLSASSTIDASGSGAVTFSNTGTMGHGNTNAKTLTLTGNNTGNNTLSAVIGNNTGATSLTKSGQGTWVLNGSSVNTYTGTTTVNTGTLVLDFANLGTPTNLVNNAAPITLAGGTLSLVGKSGANSAQTMPNPTFAASGVGGGISVAGTGGNTMGLTLGNTWTRNIGSTVNLTIGTNGSITSSPTVANTLVVGSGNIAFATVGGADWAKVSGGSVVAFAPGDYNTTFPASSSNSSVNYFLTGNGSVTATQTANTLKVSTSGAGQSLVISANQTQTLNAGGLLFVGANDYSISGGTLRGSGGTQKDLVVHQFGSGNLTIDSLITDNTAATALTKTGTGTLILTNANTFTGATAIGGGGSVVLKNALALQSSSLTINGSSLVFDSSVGGNAFTIGGLASPGYGTGYDIVLQNNAGQAITLTSNQSASTTYNGNISGNGSLVKNGSGTLTLNGYNTFTGGLVINGGTVTGALFNDWAFGPYGTGQITINSGGTLSLNRHSLSTNLILNGGTLSSGNGFGSSVSGSIVLQSTSIFQGQNNNTITVNSVISGAGGLTKNNAAGNAGTTILTNANTFTGDTVISTNTVTGTNPAVLTLANSLALQNSVLDTATSAAGNSLNGLRTTVTTLTLGGLSGNKDLSSLFITTASGGPSANIALGGYSGVSSLTLNPNASQSPSYSGNITDGLPGMSLTKTGAGTQTLNGTNTYTGITTVNQGTLRINGSIAGRLLVGAGATFGGSGTVNGSAVIQGVHAPGNSPGIQTFASDVSYSAGNASVSWELIDNTTTNQPNPNAVYDQILVGGNLTFADPTVLNLSFNGANSTVDWSNAFWSANQTWTLHDVAGTTSGFGNFTLTMTDWLDSTSATLSSVRSGASFNVSQSGQDILINYVAVPEPATLALLGAGIAFLGFRLTRRRR